MVRFILQQHTPNTSRHLLETELVRFPTHLRHVRRSSYWSWEPASAPGSSKHATHQFISPLQISQVESAILAILRQLRFDLHPGSVEKIADRVLVFVGVEAAESGAAAFGGDGAFVCGERAAQAVHQLRKRFGGRPWHSGRGHLTGRDAVVNFDPGSELIRIAGFVAEFDESGLPAEYEQL